METDSGRYLNAFNGDFSTNFGLFQFRKGNEERERETYGIRVACYTSVDCSSTAETVVYWAASFEKVIKGASAGAAAFRLTADWR